MLCRQHEAEIDARAAQTCSLARPPLPGRCYTLTPQNTSPVIPPFFGKYAGR